MKHLNKVLSVFSLFVLATTIEAQSFIPAAGGNASGSGGTVSYTIGQVVYTTVSGTGGNLTQGVQLPFEISVVTTIKEASGIILESSVYPVPAKDFVTLKVESYNTEYLSFKLYDMNGKLLQKNLVGGNETQIYLGEFSPGAYILKIFENNKEIKTFRIIKN